MLSDDLRALYLQFAEARVGGMSDCAALQFSRCLVAAAMTAAMMERCTVNDCGALTDEHLKDPKIELFPLAPRRTADGGDAA